MSGELVKTFPIPINRIMETVIHYIASEKWIKVPHKLIKTGSLNSLDAIKIVEPKALRISRNPDYIFIERKKSFDENIPAIYSVRLGYPAYEIIITIASKGESEALEIIDVDIENR